MYRSMGYFLNTCFTEYSGAVSADESLLLTFGPHGSSLTDVVDAIIPSLSTVEEVMEMFQPIVVS